MLIPLLLSLCFGTSASANDVRIRDVLRLSEQVGGDFEAFSSALKQVFPDMNYDLVQRRDSHEEPFDDDDYFKIYRIEEMTLHEDIIACAQFGPESARFLKDPAQADILRHYGGFASLGFAHTGPGTVILDCFFMFQDANTAIPFPELDPVISDMRALPGKLKFDGTSILTRSVDRFSYYLTVSYDGTDTYDIIKSAELKVEPGVVSLSFRAVLTAALLS